jgi:hypothetical protein
MARRSGNTWYVAGINGLDSEQELLLDYSFMAEGKYLVTTFADNSDKSAPWNIATTRYAHGKDSKTVVKVKSRGGFVKVIKPVRL